MKKMMLYVLLLAISATSFSQSTTPGPLTREDYLKKRKSQKAGAWMLLGGGTAVLAVTAISSASNITIGRAKRSYDVPVILGAAMMVGSVPLFIAAGKNKRKGMAITFRNTPVLQIKNSSLVHTPMPAVSIRINL